MGDYCVRWLEWNKRDQQVMKERCFDTEKLRYKFLEKIQKKDNFSEICAFSEPKSSNPLERSSKLKKKRVLNKPSRENVSVDSWNERDRLGIWATNNRTGKTIAEWWDEDAGQMFEDGFFNTRNLEESVLDYLTYMGIIK